MDIVNSARHLGHPFRFDAPVDAAKIPLAARGLIGNGYTAALVAVDGAIDWLCLPRFDSPSVFARLLDFERGGFMAVRPCGTFTSLQQYDPDTNVLETLFTQPGRGQLRTVDFMPWNDDARAFVYEVHRRVDCSEGEVEAEIIFNPRFNYGSDTPHINTVSTGVIAFGKKGERLTLSINRQLSFLPCPEGGVRATVTLKAGMSVWCVISWMDHTPSHVESHRPWEHLRSTRRKWRDWSNNLNYDGPWRHLVLRSALTLKLLIYAPTGAVVAAPTTSLPEWLGGKRNWDYRYSWTRDSSMAIRASNLIGFRNEARNFYHFLRDVIDTDVGLKLMYTIDGREVPMERTLQHLAGAFASSPVRVGNDARDQTQLDVAGVLVDAANLFERFGGVLTLPAWNKLISVLEMAEHTWKAPDNGIWEPRIAKRHNVYSKLMNWLAMDRGATLAQHFGRMDLSQRWQHTAFAIHDDICDKAMDASRTHFVAAYGAEDADATLLLLGVHGFVSDDDARLIATLRFVRSTLGHGPFLYRYKMDDGIGDEEGAFVLCGFWLAEALALQGRLDEAQEVFSAHADITNHLGLLSEEVDPRDGTLLGNFPQAFSHLGLINAATRIDLLLRLRDGGVLKAPHLVTPLPPRK